MVPGQLFGQELERHAEAELGVLDLADHAHSAAAKLFDDAIVRNSLANHEAITSQQDAGEIRFRPAYAAPTTKSTRLF